MRMPGTITAYLEAILWILLCASEDHGLPKTVYLTVCCKCRPGWSEGPTGRQLTADLKNRRAVATFADLGAPYTSPPS